MTEALYLLNLVEKGKQQELKEIQMQSSYNMVYSGIYPMEDCIHKTKDFLDKFVLVREMQASKDIRNLAKVKGINRLTYIHLINLCLTDYDEATSLFPELKLHNKEDVMEVLNMIKEKSRG